MVETTPSHQGAALPSVLLLSMDNIGPRMAGTGIRYWNLARVIGQQQPVTLAAPNPVELPPPPGVTLVAYGGPGVDEDAAGQRRADLVASHDIIVAQQIPYYDSDPEVLASRYLVVDLYAPSILENLEYARVDPERGEPVRKDDVAIMNRLLSLGDFFVCASERQRDFWLGALAVAGRLEPAHLEADPELRSLIDLLPFGLPEAPPEKTGPGPRGSFAGIGPEDIVLLWNGGLWNWLDPLTAIHAVGRLASEGLPVRLVFMGTRSPVRNVADMKVVDEARSAAETLGLLDRHVFFNDWVPYEERQNWLLEADVAVSLHGSTIESRYAFRTRLLDSLWCGLPTLATEGDVLADIVRDEQIGRTVPPGDVDAVVAAIRALIDPVERRALDARISAVAARYTWERVSAPLLAYCRAPWRLGQTRGNDPTQAYIHHLERIYDETAGYARHLERAIAERDAALAARLSLRGMAWQIGSTLKKRLLG